MSYSQHLGANVLGAWEAPTRLSTLEISTFFVRIFVPAFVQLPSLEAKVRIQGQNIYLCNAWVLQGLC